MEDSPVEFKGIKKEDSGKPSLIHDEYGISLSHSKGYAAAIIDRSQKNIGIDIENIQPKVLRLLPRFGNEEELHFAQSQGEDPTRITSYNVCYTKLLRPLSSKCITLYKPSL